MIYPTISSSFTIMSYLSCELTSGLTSSSPYTLKKRHVLCTTYNTWYITCKVCTSTYRHLPTHLTIPLIRVQTYSLLENRRVPRGPDPSYPESLLDTYLVPESRQILPNIRWNFYHLKGSRWDRSDQSAHCTMVPTHLRPPK